jgi:hypothetical protein
MIDATRPEELFEYGSARHITTQYRRLAKLHHPDKGGTTADFQLLKDLYELAIKKVEASEPWDNGSDVTFAFDGTTLRLKYEFARNLEVGRMFVSRGRVLYLLDAPFADLGEAGRALMEANRLHPGPIGTRDTNLKLLPRQVPQTASWRLPPTIVVLSKEPDVRPLRALLDLHGPMPAVHTAWMIGRLMHLLCYLEWRGIVHGDISVDSLFVNTDDHSLHLYGGWWYARTSGERFVALPARSVRLCPPDVLLASRADKRLDFELARHTAIEILGVPSATELRMRKDVPTQLADFLSAPFTASSAMELYSQWEKARDSAFGERKFVKFNVPKL